eukprot:3933053-Amphidinium_carterae.1
MQLAVLLTDHADAGVARLGHRAGALRLTNTQEESELVSQWRMVEEPHTGTAGLMIFGYHSCLRSTVLCGLHACEESLYEEIHCVRQEARRQEEQPMQPSVRNIRPAHSPHVGGEEEEKQYFHWPCVQMKARTLQETFETRDNYPLEA